jgi:hypothetical protein
MENAVCAIGNDNNKGLSSTLVKLLTISIISLSILR